MTVEEWLGKDNTLGIDIWKKKYRYNGESFDQWLDRVSGGDEELREYIKDKKFMFGGRITANRGTNKNATMMNCYSRGFVGDSLAEIMKANTDIAMTFKAQGGQGLSLSKIRPKGTGINHGQFKSDGIIPFMEIFNKTTESVSQGGSRKGALLMSLDAWHKEAKDFITIKSDENRIQKANLSLEIDDEFMEDVEKYYKTGEVVKKHIVRDYGGNRVEYDVCPIEVYKLMMQQAWESGEPGCLMVNRFRNYNLMEYCNDYNIECCNPCTTGDTLILTDEGFVEIKSVVDKKVNVWNGYMYSQVVPRKTAIDQEIYEVEFSNGAKLKCTPYHKFILDDGSRVECKDLSVGDKLVKCNMPIIDGANKLEHPYTQGFYSGDGFDCKGRNAAYISFYGDKKPLSQYCDVISQREMSDKRDTYSVNVDCHNKEFVPINYNIKSKIRWLEGIVDSDGTKGSKDGSLQITSTNKKFLYKVFLMLETLGVQSTVSLSKEECDKYFPEQMGGKYYHCNALYRLLIKASDVVNLRKLGFAPHRVDVNCSPSRNAQRFVTIKSVKNTGTREDVYCFTEEINHSGIFNGVITGQCGEQPLAKNAACDLGSINLAKFVINEFEPDARFDFESFGKVIDCGVRSLDLIIDENEKNHALEEQRLQSKNYRNIGLGVMGLYDCLVEMNMTYGSQESIHFIDSLFGYMFRRAVIASSKLASEKGAFPNYSDNVLKSKIIRKHFTDDDLNILGIRKNGLRNCSLLSIAPTGSIGTMFNIGTGCEPAFMLSFKRKTESLKGKDEYYTVYMDVAQRYKDSHKGSELPDTFVTSQNINWKDRINVQAAIQEHVDTGISSTVNLPNKITVEEVEQLYLYAWKKGLKGVTIFRDGCKRAGILTTTDKKEDDDKVTMQDISRGVIIKADDNCIGKKRTLTSGCGRMHLCAYFNPDTGALLETYVNRGSQGGCVCSYTGLSRMMSLAARGGIDIYSIVDQLKSSGSCPSYAVRSATRHDTSKGNCCPTAIGNALIDMYNEVQEELGLNDDADKPVTKKAVKQKQVKIVAPKTESKDIEDASDMLERGICPNCGEPLQHTGACLTCVSCGYSKCE